MACSMKGFVEEYWEDDLIILPPGIPVRFPIRDNDPVYLLFLVFGQELVNSGGRRNPNSYLAALLNSFETSTQGYRA